jgi:hypothetical protein
MVKPCSKRHRNPICPFTVSGTRTIHGVRLQFSCLRKIRPLGNQPARLEKILLDPLTENTGPWLLHLIHVYQKTVVGFISGFLQLCEPAIPSAQKQFLVLLLVKTCSKINSVFCVKNRIYTCNSMKINLVSLRRIYPYWLGTCVF